MDHPVLRDQHVASLRSKPKPNCRIEVGVVLRGSQERLFFTDELAVFIGNLLSLVLDNPGSSVFTYSSGSRGSFIPIHALSHSGGVLPEGISTEVHRKVRNGGRVVPAPGLQRFPIIFATAVERLELEPSTVHSSRPAYQE